MTKTAGASSRAVLLAATLALALPTAGAAELDGQTTGGIPIKGDRLTGPNLTALKLGLSALASGDAIQAREIRDRLPSTALDRHILAWAIALKGGPDVPNSDIVAAQALSNWPGMDVLRRNSERAMLRENPGPELVVRALAGTTPQTADGVIALARAYVALSDQQSAKTMLSAFWRGEKMDAADEAAIIREFGGLISTSDHRYRMERMLYADRAASAKRVAALADAEALCQAWVAVINGDKVAPKLLAAVPQAQQSAGYIFAKTRWLRRAEKIEDAAKLMLSAPTDAASLVDPDAWWIERRALSRELMDQGDTKTAYTVASAHAAESPLNQADAEFHAGWYALRGLSDAKAGARHFSRIAEVATGPITLSRAYYWLGRTAEAGGPGDAEAYYRRAAIYGTSFYGQLAAEKVGLSALSMTAPTPTMAERVSFGRRESVIAIGRLESAGYPAMAETLYRDLAGELESPGELALLAGMAERQDNHYLALKVAKIAGARGIDIGALSHPVGAIPATADISGAGKALAYAIARQESEFKTSAISRAGALGLLQLMPSTAKTLAKKAGLAFSEARLVSDPGYNATLGSAFLGEQLTKFHGSYILTFAGYNAGPRRAQEWIARYGDPRGKDLDTIVDWIERIPFAETRSYVQRVMENYQVYRMRLTGKFDIESDLRQGRS